MIHIFYYNLVIAIAVNIRHRIKKETIVDTCVYFIKFI